MATRQQELCEAVASWLHYKSLTGLRRLMNESSIKVPIAEFLSTNSKQEVLAEVEHPKFANKDRGRPKQIDFVVKRNGQSWVSIYECKFHRDTKVRLIADLCRLLVFDQSLEKGNPDRFFLYCGRLSTGKNFFENRTNSHANGRIELFHQILKDSPDDLDQPQQVNVNELDGAQSNFFSSFCSENDVELPLMFDTKLVGRAQSGDFLCCVWKITQRRGTGFARIKEVQKPNRGT